ncbi:MAG: glycosyltransferase family 4 protein [Alphaproteobacteria bacterium]
MASPQRTEVNNFRRGVNSVHAPLAVNHVLSTGLLDSIIFDDIIMRLASRAGARFEFHRSVSPLPKMDVYHYHRANRESRLKHPAVVTVHHDPDDPYFWLRLRRFLPRWREADVVICINNAHQRRLQAEGIQNTMVIPHGVDRSVLPVPGEPRRRRPGEPLRLGIVSRRHKRGFKGEDRMHALFDRLNPEHFAFTIVGADRDTEAVAAHRKGFEVSFHPRLPYGLFGALYGRIDMLVILSYWEAGPACLPEALGSGIPVATTGVGMAYDLVQDGINGILLTGDADCDAATLSDLAESTDDMGRLMDGAFATAGEIPSWDAIIARHFEVYRALAEGGQV